MLRFGSHIICSGNIENLCFSIIDFSNNHSISNSSSMLEEIFAKIIKILWAEHDKSDPFWFSEWFRFKACSHQNKSGMNKCVLDEHKHLHVIKSIFTNREDFWIVFHHNAKKTSQPIRSLLFVTWPEQNYRCIHTTSWWDSDDFK